MQTIPIGLNSTNQVSVTESNVGTNSNSVNTVMGSGKLSLKAFKIICYDYSIF